MSDTKLYLGIEVGDVSLKVALLDGAEKRVLKTAVLQTETSPIDDIYTFETVLQGWMDECHLEEIEAISVTVPAFRSIVRQVFVPAEAVANIDDYVQWYLGLITNGDKGSYIIDYKILGGDSSVGQTVLLIAVRREWVDALRKGFRSKNLVPKGMEVDVLSLMNLMDVAEGVKKELECVIKADYFGVTLLWLRINEAVGILADGIVEQMKLAREQNAVPEVKQVHLCGEMAMEPLFVQKLREKFADSCQIALMDSFSKLRLPVDEADSAAVLNCAGAIGTALGVMEGV